MSLTKLEFKKDWNNSQDFPTYQDSETQVRADLQYHPDAIKAYVNEVLLPELEKHGVLEITRTDGSTLKYIRLNREGNVETSVGGEDWTTIRGDGHIILGPDETVLPMRGKMRILNAALSDDGEATVVDVGVSSFNGRSGAVAPQAGDYTPEMVGAAPAAEKGVPNGVATLGSDGKVPEGQLPNSHVGVVSANITLPAGRMRGDINGDGLVDSTDRALLRTQNAASDGGTYFNIILDTIFPDGDIPIDYLAADINGDGAIDVTDSNEYYSAISSRRFTTRYSVDLLGAWTLDTDAIVYYIDIPITGMKATHSAVVVVEYQAEIRNADIYSGVCGDGYIRIYAKRCPIVGIAASVTYFGGDGSVNVVSPRTGVATLDEDGMVSKGQLPNMGIAATITIPFGRMRGDVNGDGLVDSADLGLIQDGTASDGGTYYGVKLDTDFPDGNIPLDYLLADVNNDGAINSVDTTEIALAMNKGYLTTSYSEDMFENWTLDTEAMVYYVDIPVTGMKATHSAVVVVEYKDKNKNSDIYSGVCGDGYIRIYAKRCPLARAAASVTFYDGDGSVNVVSPKPDAFHIEVGEYYGTDTYGRDNPTVLTFPKAVAMLIITDADGATVVFSDINDRRIYNLYTADTLYVTWGSGNTTLSFYSETSAESQLNSSYDKKYIAFYK